MLKLPRDPPPTPHPDPTLPAAVGRETPLPGLGLRKRSLRLWGMEAPFQILSGAGNPTLQAETENP